MLFQTVYLCNVAKAVMKSVYSAFSAAFCKHDFCCCGMESVAFEYKSCDC